MNIALNCNELFKITLAIGLLGIICCGMILIYKILKNKNQGIGPNTLKTIGIVLFLPILVLLSLFIDFHSATIAALLGTVAGYILSTSEKESKNKVGQ